MTNKEFLESIELEFKLHLGSAFLHWKRGWINENSMRRERRINLEWYRRIYQFLNPKKEVDRTQLSEDLIKQYDTKEGFPLCSLIYYHDVVIPVYDDDYGQQVFAVIGDQKVSGGSYNFDYAHDFCAAIDAMLEHQQWDDMEQEYNKPEN